MPFLPKRCRPIGSLQVTRLSSKATDFDLFSKAPTTEILDMQEQTRRRFMVSTAAAVAGLCVSRNVQADQSKKLKGMTLGFSTYGMKVLKTEAALEHIAKIGFDAVEMTVRADWDSAPGNMDAKRRTSIRNQLKDGGLELSSFMEHLYLGQKFLTKNFH